MVIYKILNNNLILSRDGQGHEVIVKGCGIAFLFPGRKLAGKGASLLSGRN